MQYYRPIKYALLSVSNKSNIVDFAKALSMRGIKIISTSGTARHLINEGLTVIEISEYIKLPEVMDGRVKTLHYKIQCGILWRRNKDDHIISKYKIIPIDMVVVNFYPFVKSTNLNHNILNYNTFLFNKSIDNIDIGGVNLVRSAAKNYKDVTVITDNNDFNHIIKEIDNNNGSVLFNTRFNLAVKAFEYVASYDKEIFEYLRNFINKEYNIFNNCKKKDLLDRFPQNINLNFIKKQDISYGENSHQQAAFYVEKEIKEVSVATAKQLQGKMLSYNNISDADIALECIKQFNEPACVIVKHTSPCSVALSNSILDAYKIAYKSDPISAFGGVIAFNREFDDKTAKIILNNQFIEVIIAPSFTKEALKVIAFKKNIRILSCGYWSQPIPKLKFKSVNSGLLIQDYDIDICDISKLSIVSKRKPNKEELDDALFSWKVVKFVKSNAIVLAKNRKTIGIGSGQTSRINSIRMASFNVNNKINETKGSVMASDAFLPFVDCIESAANLGIFCIIQPGGSIRDSEIIEAADVYNISMLFTGIRHFSH